MTDSTPRVESEGVPLKDSEWVLEEAPIPFIGWYFAFRIDPQATLPFLRKDGLSAFREQSNIYVGYLESMNGLYNPDKATHMGSVALLSPELSSNEKRFRTADMAVAMLPNSEVVASRQPVRTNPPLPWAHAFQQTVDCGIPRIRIKSRMVGCRKTYELPHKGRALMRRYATEDRQRRHALAYAAHEINPSQPESLVGNELEQEAPADAEDDVASVASTTRMLDAEEGPITEQQDTSDSTERQLPRGDPLTFANVTGEREMDDVDEALMIIEAANAHHEKANPYAPVLEIVTYDLSTITTFGTPEAFLKEVAKLEQLIPEHEAQMKAQYEQDKRDLIRTHRNSLPPDRFPWLADVPTRAMSEPADDRDIPDLDPTELQTAIHRYTKSAQDKASKASDLRRRAEANLCRVKDLRQQADVLAHDADVYQVEAAVCEAAAAEARKDEENAKSFASFLGIDIETGGGSQMMLDRFLTSLPLSDEPVGPDDVPATTTTEKKSKKSKTRAANPKSTTSDTSFGGSWLARLGEVGLVLTAGILIGRAWRKW